MLRNHPPVPGLEMPFPRVVEYISAVIPVVDAAARMFFSDFFAIDYGAAIMVGHADETLLYQQAWVVPGAILDFL